MKLRDTRARRAKCIGTKSVSNLILHGCGGALSQGAGLTEAFYRYAV